MPKAKTPFDEIVETLGGVSKTARALGRAPSQVCQWRERHGRFPAAMFFKLSAKLGAMGKECPREAFRFDDDDDRKAG